MMSFPCSYAEKFGKGPFSINGSRLCSPPYKYLSETLEAGNRPGGVNQPDRKRSLPTHQSGQAVRTMWPGRLRALYAGNFILRRNAW
ncbi:hypothetical protein SBBP2_2340002 [Burkholderiales bacterium]|nr:hypothetical protein SBBP2_2340002 [Burkholderiales bacterium]